jgi:hypothetical protein
LILKIFGSSRCSQRSFLAKLRSCSKSRGLQKKQLLIEASKLCQTSNPVAFDKEIEMSSSRRETEHQGSSHRGSAHTGSRPSSSNSASSHKDQLHLHPSCPGSHSSSYAGQAQASPHAQADSAPAGYKPPFNMERLNIEWPLGSPAFNQSGHIIPHQFYGVRGKNPDNRLSYHPLDWRVLEKEENEEKPKRLIIARTNYLTQQTFSYHHQLSKDILRLIEYAKQKKKYSLRKPDKPLEMPLS